MKYLIHSLGAGVSFMFLMTAVSLVVILEALGLGFLVTMLIGCSLAYLRGRVKGAEIERSIFMAHERHNHDR